MSDVVEPNTGVCYYSVLGITREASDCEIRGACRKMALKWHPDRWTKDPRVAIEAKRQFQQIQEAYSVLSDKGKRTMYDAGLLGLVGEDDNEDEKSTLEDLARLLMDMMADSEETGKSAFHRNSSTGPTKKIRIY